MNNQWSGWIVVLTLLGGPGWVTPGLAGDPPQRNIGNPGQRDGAGREAAPWKGRGERPFPQPAQRAGQGPFSRDIDQVVALMMRQFDTDGDEKLDRDELTKMLTAMRQRPAMAGAFSGPPISPRPQAGDRPRRPQNELSREPGGVTPKRPPSK
jgi:hypothetical protein